MRPFRKNLAISIDGGGLRGLIAICALEEIEKALGQPLYKTARLLSGSSTGSIIAGAIASGLTAAEIHQLYAKLGDTVFRKSWRTLPIIGAFSGYQYDRAPLAQALHDSLGDRKVGDFWSATPQTDLLITTFDLIWNKTRFIKPWKADYADWPLVDALLASSAAPTYFSVFQGRYTDGGLGNFNNPCLMVAYEAEFCLGWKPKDTTLISLGTGREPAGINGAVAANWHIWDWLNPTVGAFMDSANDLQVNIVDTYCSKFDFRRFQVDFHQPVGLVNPQDIPVIEQYGKAMGQMILNDQIDSAAQGLDPTRAVMHGQ